ncbi:MAG: hypothetical protein PHQ05_04750 [Sterolibacterium sp.]|nr:hypothetical protein [Sterolibacterium sp.]
MVLYKYLPHQFADVVLRGEILFRNLSHFKRLECKTRGDATEGIHRDRPETGATIENLSVGGTINGDFTFLNEIESDLVYVFCTSEIFDKTLFCDFEVDCCIEIYNSDEFAKRIQRKVMSLASTNKSIGLLRGSANYYDPGNAVEFDVKNPRTIAFAKDISYAHQKEFRFAFGRGKKSFCIQESIVISKRYDFQAAAESSTRAEKKLLIGSVKDIARIHPESPCFNSPPV